MVEEEEKVCSLVFCCIIGGGYALSLLKFPSGGAGLHNLYQAGQVRQLYVALGLKFTNASSPP